MPDLSQPNPDLAPIRPKQLGWGLTLAVAAFVLVAYWTTACAVDNTASPQHAYFDHLADSFLHGILYLPNPPGEYDLTQHNGRWYVPFPPLAAALMLPWVALFGIEGTNTVVFSIIFAALNLIILARILDALAQRGWVQSSRTTRCWLLALFAFGCVYWQVAIEGSVWFLSHVCTITFIGLAVWLALKNANPLLVGTALAISFWGRPNVVFTWPLLLGIFAQVSFDSTGVIRRNMLLRWATLSLVPIAVSVLGLMWYNYARFQNPFDFGYKTQNVSAAVIGDLSRGQFHIYHLPRNLHTMLMAPPRWYEPESLPNWRLPIPDAHGMSIFLTTPLLFYVIRARRRREYFTRGAWLATGLLLVPLLLYYNTGWRQFGYRFSLDFIIPAMILLTIAIGRRTTWPMRTLIILSFIINAWGVVWWYTNWLD